jgi:hypothetical protein
MGVPEGVRTRARDGSADMKASIAVAIFMARKKVAVMTRIRTQL